MMTNGSVAASHRRSSRSAALVLRNTIAVMLGRLAQPSARAYSQLLHQVQEPVPALKITGTHAFPCRCSPWHTAARTVPMRCLSTSNVALTSSVSDQGQVRVAFVGAGGVNFGTSEGPWNHAARVEQLPGVTVTAIVDPNETLAQQRIDTLQQGEHGGVWADTKVFSSYQAMLQDANAKPNAAFIGLPPKWHGALEDKQANIELEMAQAGISLFVEKPLSLRPAAEVAQLAHELKHLQEQNNAVIAVGYMFRYSALAQTAKKILQEHNAKPLCVIARYACGYSDIQKKDWWDTAVCGGPIVEQATHFVDLMRFFGGEIVEDTVRAVAVGPEQPLVDMPAAPNGEQEVPMERRNNRVTAAVWQFDSGAIGSLTHSTVLHTSHYETELEILADGMHLLLIDPYNKPQLKVRYPGSAEYKEVKLDDRDMYMIEAETFIDAVKTGNTDAIETLYEDSALSYQASQWITASSNQSRTQGTEKAA